MISVSDTQQLNRRKLRFIWTATAVLLLASVFRLWALDKVPPGLSQDEVLNADIVQMIRQGNHAIFFRAGFGHEPLYHYWSVPFQMMLGDNLLSIRLPAVFLGLLLIAATMRWARRGFGYMPAIATGIGLAVSWWPIIFSRIGLRPILEPLLLVAAAWFWPKRPWVTAVFLGLAFYSYTSAWFLFLIPPGLAAVHLLFATGRRERLEIIRRTALMLTILVLFYAPLYVTLRADPTLQQRVTQLEGPLNALRAGDPRPIWEATRATLGLFTWEGDPRWTYMLAGEPLFDWATGLLFYGGLLLAIRYIRREQMSYLLVWFAVALLPSAVTPQAPSTVRLIGALPVVYLFPGLAVAFLHHWGEGRVAGKGRPVWWFLPFMSVMLLLIIVNVSRTVQNGFLHWAQVVETRVTHYQAIYNEMNYYLRDQFAENSPQPLVIADNFVEQIDIDSLQRTFGREIESRWIEAGPAQAGAFVWPAGGSEGLLLVPEYAPLSTNLWRWLVLPQEPMARSNSVPAFAVYYLPQKPGFLTLDEPVSFDGLLTLEGYDLLLPEGSEPLILITLWQVNAPLPWNLTAFIHLVDAQGDIIAQHDGFDAAPFQLQPGDWVAQVHPLPVEFVGEFQVQLGLYLPDTGFRLSPVGAEGERLILIESLLLTE